MASGFMLSREGDEPAMGDKIKAKRSFENEQEEFEVGICDPNYAMAISICGSQTILMVTPNK
jgi:hypothetical protein